MLKKIAGFMRKDAVLSIAANLGSTFTPIGNPQNLYLFGKTELRTLEFLKLMFPYTFAAFVLLLVLAYVICRENAAWKGRYLRLFTLANLIF